MNVPTILNNIINIFKDTYHSSNMSSRLPFNILFVVLDCTRVDLIIVFCGKDARRFSASDSVGDIAIGATWKSFQLKVLDRRGRLFHAIWSFAPI